jgi:hypothetical protein
MEESSLSLFNLAICPEYGNHRGISVSRSQFGERESLVLLGGYFAASGPGRLALIEGTMNSALYQRILQENVRPAVCELKLKCSWVMQQDNDPKHTKST